jgi:predicted ATP-dependent endonuclease of OLD family
MELNSFSVTNYRSITDAHKISLSGKTTLIGKNNEGKSNILKGLKTAMRLLNIHAKPTGRIPYIEMKRYYGNSDDMYEWNRDFPISYQNRKSGLQTIFRLDFTLNEEDKINFNEKIKSKINGSLSIEIKIGRENSPSVKVLEKRGKGGKTINAKSKQIADFVAENIVFNYIPAIRTDTESMEVVRDMLALRLKSLEEKPEYKSALETIRKIQEPVLEELSNQIKIPLQEFLPNINDVTISIPENTRRLSMRNDFDIIIDDGTATNLAYKGDGVKSLAALGLLKNRQSRTGASIIAIEEPESHLHPAAIHQLNEIVNSLALENQVVITTHNPLFVDRENIKSNIIVHEGKATPSKSTKQIRDILGIKASDNLINASYVLIVEGEDDVISLKAILPSLSEKLSRALKSNLLIIEAIGGAGNLPYKLTLLKNTLCVYHCLLDNDSAGKLAYSKAEAENLLSIRNTTFINCNGFKEAEFEDCLNRKIYTRSIFDNFGVELDISRFKSNKKWSDRVKDIFLNNGKPWNDQIEKQIKNTVAECVKNSPIEALNPHMKNSIDALVNALEQLIKS